MNKVPLLNEYTDKINTVIKKIDLQEIEGAIDIIRDKMKGKSNIFTCGNGGSACTANHYITDWNKMVNKKTGAKFFGQSLCSNIGIITALGNDEEYSEIFSGQLSAVARSGDLLICISGSGNSENLLKAVEYSKKNDIKTLGILGYDGGRLLNLCDNSILVPSFDMQICEDIHLIIGHMIMKAITEGNVI